MPVKTLDEMLAEYAAGKTGEKPVSGDKPVPVAKMEEPIKAEEKKEPSTIQKFAAGGLRVAGPILGGVAGIPLGLPGIIGGGAAGGALGETLAQTIEGREKYSLPSIAAETAFGAIPATAAVKAGKPLLSAGLGAVQAAGHSGLYNVAEGVPASEAFSPGNLAIPAVGGAFFGGLGGKFAKAHPKGLGSKAKPDVDVPTVPKAPEPITSAGGLKTRLDQVDPETGFRVPLTEEERKIIRPALLAERNKPNKPLTTLLKTHKEADKETQALEDLLYSDIKRSQKAAASDVGAMADLEEGRGKVTKAATQAQQQELKKLEDIANVSATKEKVEAGITKAAEKESLEATRRQRIQDEIAGKVYRPAKTVSESVSAVDPVTGATLRTGGKYQTKEATIDELMAELKALVGKGASPKVATKPVAPVVVPPEPPVGTSKVAAVTPTPKVKAPRIPKLKTPAAPVASEAEMGELRRITEEMKAMPFTKRVMREPDKGGGLEHVEGTGGAGANVYNDIVQEAGLARKTRGQVQADLEAFLAGTGKPTRAVKAALEVAKARIAGKYRTTSGVKISSPELPPSAAEPPMSVEDFAQALGKEGQKPLVEDIPFNLAREADTTPSAVQQGLRVAPPEPTVPPTVAAEVAPPTTWQEALAQRLEAEGSGDKAKRGAAWKVWQEKFSKPMEAKIATKLQAGQPLDPDEAEFITDLANRLHGGDMEAAGNALVSRVGAGPKMGTKAATQTAKEELKALSKLKGPERKAAIEAMKEPPAFEKGYEDQLGELANLDPEARASLIQRFIKGESGEVNPELAMRLGLHATTGLIGAGAGAALSNPGEEGQGALLGGMTGALAPYAAPKMNFKPGEIMQAIGNRLPDIYRGNLLANPNNLAANVFAAPLGLGTTGGIEEILSGNVRPGVEMLKRVPSLPYHTIRNFPKAYQILKHEPELNVAELAHLNQPRNLFDAMVAAPAVSISAGDVALKQAAEQSGLGEKALEMALASEPIKTTGPRMMRVWGQRMLDARKPIEGEGRNYLGELAIPFMRTAANVAIATPTRTPGLGVIANLLTNPQDRLGFQQLAAQQGMGTAIGMLGYQLGYNMDPETAKLARPWVRNSAGKYSAVMMAAFEAGLAARSGKKVPVAAARGFTQEGLPLETGRITGDMGKFVASLFDDSGKGPRMPGGVLPSFLVQAYNEQRDKR